MSGWVNPYNWYWDTLDTFHGTDVWQSSSGTYVPLANADYTAFLAAGLKATVIDTFAHLMQVVNVSNTQNISNANPSQSFWGRTFNSGASITLTNPLTNDQIVGNPGGVCNVTLPQMNKFGSIPIGFPIYINNSQSTTCNVNNFSGASVVVLSALQTAIVILRDNTTAGGLFDAPIIVPSTVPVPLTVPLGGTGDITLTAHSVLLGEGTSPVAFAAPSSAGQFLRDQGASVDPSFAAIGSGDLPTVPVTKGGTNLTTLTAHAVVLGEGTSSVGFATIGTAGRYLRDQGAGADPAFNAISSADISSVAVTSFNTRVGAVVPTTGDYNTTQITNYGAFTATLTSTQVVSANLIGQSGNATAAYTVVGTPGPYIAVGGLGSSPVNVIYTRSDGGLQVTNTAGSTTYATINSSGLALSTPLTVANGGTGDATLTAHSVLLGEGTSPVAFATIGTAGRYLRDQGAGADPSFVAISTADLPVIPVSGGGTGATKSNYIAVDLNGSNQSGNAGGAFSKVLFSNKVDPDGVFDAVTNHRYTPNVAGKFLVCFAWGYASAATDGDAAIASIYKNGAEFRRFSVIWTGAAHGSNASGAVIIDMNGTTDFLEFFAFASSLFDITGSTTQTWVTAQRIGT